MPDDYGFLDYLPTASAGFSGLQFILNLIQQHQRNQQLEQLRRHAEEVRRYYTDPAQINARAAQFWESMRPAAEHRLSGLVGDAASRGWSGYPAGLASLVARAYAPYQTEALRMAQGYGRDVSPFLGEAGMVSAPGAQTNPFESFLRSLQAIRGYRGGGGGGGGVTLGGTPAEGSGRYDFSFRDFLPSGGDETVPAGVVP